jgi:phage/plasmid-like protein (TIGR03299 family)
MHALDITDGQATYLGAREDAWHQLGKTMSEEFTAKQAMDEGLLGGWDVRKVPVYAEVGGKKMEVPNRVAIVRNNPVRKGQTDVFDVVGKNYQPIQNEDHAGLLDALVDESGAHFSTAGAIYGGRQVFLTMKLPGHINIGGVDPVENYIAAFNSHDGSMAFTLMVTPVRVECANLMNMAFQNHSHIFRIRHTSGAEAALRSRAREALDMTFKHLDAFQEEAEKMINTTMTQAKFETIIEAEFGAPEDASPSVVTRADKKIAAISELFADAHTQEGIRNTAWAGFNALTEWADHFSPTRGDTQDTDRAIKAVLDPSFKQRALSLMMAAV